MGDNKLIMPYEHNVLHKADSGSVRFQVRTEGSSVEITLISKQDPSMQLYQITLGPLSKVNNLLKDTMEVFETRSVINFREFQDIWLTWFNSKIQIGLEREQKPFLVCESKLSEKEIGFIQYTAACWDSSPVEWIIETTPVMLKPVPYKKFEETLNWLSLINGKLPPDAMIGGFENEFTYIARAYHNNSLCPGKYVPSTGLAYVPWGGREHSKQHFEILCGFNGQWIKTRSNQIPLNAFIAGQSEQQNDPLYIGRAMLKNKLITGKVHVRYDLCYLPFKGKEVEVSSYEILVIPENKIPQALCTQ